jgi:hypothetical protein
MLMAQSSYTLYKCVKVDGQRRYCSAVFNPKNRGIVSASDDRKESHEKHKQAPVHFLVYQMRVSGTRDEHHGCSERGERRRSKTRREPCPDHSNHNAWLEQGGTIHLGDVGGDFALNVSQSSVPI